MAAFAERLKEAMELKGLKQADVIRLAQPFGEPVGIRIGKSHMSQYVSGKTEPRRDILKVLAQALEVDYLWLEGDDVAMTADSHPAKEQQSKNSWSIGEDGMRTFNKSSKLDNVLYDERTGCRGSKENGRCRYACSEIKYRKSGTVWLSYTRRGYL